MRVVFDEGRTGGCTWIGGGFGTWICGVGVGRGSVSSSSACGCRHSLRERVVGKNCAQLVDATGVSGRAPGTVQGLGYTLGLSY